MVDLLAHPKHKLYSTLGKILHGPTKLLIRKAIDRIANKMRPVTEYKRKEGWHYDTNRILDEILTEIVEDEESAPLGPDNKDYRLWHNFRDILLTINDEDSYYHFRMCRFLCSVIERRDELWTSMHVYHPWGELWQNYKDLKAKGLLPHQSSTAK